MSSFPGNAADVKAIVEERLAALDSSGELRQTATIEWRGQQKIVSVIDMPTSLLYFNPDTHRIRAQRSLNPARELELESHPFGQSAQDYLHSLLRGSPQDPNQEDPTFTLLKESLAQHGQEEPGIITRAGVLVNGNTRCAALRELHREHIRVGVLPPDAAFDDVRAIELSLQLRKEYKREYSFVNFLLAVKERSDAGQSDADIKAEFRIYDKTLQRSRWILNLIEEAIERSRPEPETGDAIRLRLIDFETHQGKLEELYTAYAALKPKNPEAADALREQRLLALVLDKSKTDLRLIEPNFVSTYLPYLAPTTDGMTETARTIPGTQIPLPQPSESLAQLRKLTNSALRAKAVVIVGNTTDVSLGAASKHLQELTVAVDGALDKAGKNARIKKRQVAPAERVSDTVDALDLAVQAIVEARASGHFSIDDLDEALLHLRDALIRVARQVSIGLSGAESDGVRWLLASAKTDLECHAQS